MQGVIAGVFSQITTIVIGILSVYYGIRYFGPVIYGMWLTIRSLLCFSNYTLFGVDAVAATLIAQANEPIVQKTIIAKSLKILILTTLLGGAILSLLLINPHWLLLAIGQVSEQYQTLAIDTLIVLLIGQLLQQPLTLCFSIFTGLQQVHLARFYQIILPTTLSFVVLIITIFLGRSLLFLSALTAIATLLASLIGMLHMFIQNNELRFNPLEKLPSSPTTKYIFNKGLGYFIIGIASLIILNSDNVVINQFLGPTYVSQFAISYKLFSLAYVLIALINSSVWPILSRKIGRREWQWVNENYNFLLFLFLIFGGLIWVGGVAFAKPVISLWAGAENYAGNLTIFMFGAYGYVISFSAFNITVLNSLNSTKVRIWLIPLEVCINLILSIVLIQSIGISGVAIGTLASLLVTEIWLLPLCIHQESQKHIQIKTIAPLKHLFFVITPLVTATTFLIQFNQLWAIALKLSFLLIYLAGSWIVLSKQQKQIILELINSYLNKLRRNQRSIV